MRTACTLLLLPVLLSCNACIFYRYQSAACKERGAAVAARVKKLEADAHQNLKIGTKKEEVVRFFAENGIPLNFVEGLAAGNYEAAGTIHTTGCAPDGCGSDKAVTLLQVKVDKTGRVVSEPHVSGIYTDCL